MNRPRSGTARRPLLVASALSVVGILVVACGSTEHRPSGAERAPASAPPPTAQSSTGRAPPSASAQAPVDLAACSADDECTFVALGCCSTTPVNKVHAERAQRDLEASGRPFCPVKQACGPGKHGDWEGAPGRCIAGRCGCDPSHPLASNCRGE